MSRLAHEPPAEVEYPDSDGEPMADNTLQFQWIMTLQGGLDDLFRYRDDVFVAGDLLWYPVQGQPKVRAAPDALVAFGRPKGYRGSYKQWEEGGVAPQVVFEVLSPNNRPEEMQRKFEFYQRHGVEEYYLYDPDAVRMEGWVRRGDVLEALSDLHDWTSPRLGILFDLSGDELRVIRPDGRPFLTYLELAEQRDEERQRAEEERRRAEEEQRQRALADRCAEEARRRAEAQRQRAEEEHRQRALADQQAQQERQRADEERQRAERLAERLRQAGIDPDA